MIQNDFWIPHRPDPRRRPRHDQRSPLQCRPLREERNRFLYAEDHFFRVAVLDDVAVVDGFDGEIVRVGDGVWRDDDGADGGGGVETWGALVLGSTIRGESWGRGGAGDLTF